MEFNIKSGSPEKQRVACVIVGVYETRKLTLAADLLDRISNGFVSDVIRRGDMEGKLGSTLILHSVPHALERDTGFNMFFGATDNLIKEATSLAGVTCDFRHPLFVFVEFFQCDDRDKNVVLFKAVQACKV